MQLSVKDLVTVNDLSRRDIDTIFDVTRMLKTETKAGKRHYILDGKSLGMIFEKPSTRTRVSFEVAMTQLGGHALYLSKNDIQLSRGETIEDTARVLSRMVDGLIARVYEHEKIEQLALNTTIPVINALSDMYHPCQALADFYTIYEYKHRFDVKVAYVGDGNNNVTHSLMLLGSKLGSHMIIASPNGYEPDKSVIHMSDANNELSNGTLEITDDIEAVDSADVIYTDTWVSMGKEAEQTKRIEDLKPYQVNPELMAKADRNAIFMHCLPAHRGYEVTDEVIDSDQSVVWEEAENRLHVQKAILALLMR